MIPKLIFIFDKERDLRNIWETANKENSYMNFVTNIPKKWFEICKDNQRRHKICPEKLL